MEQNRTIMQLVRYGQADEILNILDREVPTREIFLHHTRSSPYQFIGLAASKGYIELMKRCVVKYGVKMEIGTEEGLHAMIGAASMGHDNVIEWLLEPWIYAGRVIDGKRHSDKKQLPPGWLQPALHKAIRGLHVSTVKLLVESAWADVNACDNDNLRPLHMAANFVDKNNPEQIFRYEEIVEILLTAGAQVNELNPLTKRTPLYDAVSLDSRAATKRLLDGGADVLIGCTETKTTVLHLAAAAGFQETLRMMLDHYQSSEIGFCDFDVKDEDGITPLHAAVYGGDVECVRILIKKGSSLANVTKAKKTVMDAIFKKVPQPIDFLTEILDKQVSFTDESYNKVNVNFQVITARPSAQFPEDGSTSDPDLDVVFALIEAVSNGDQLTTLHHPLLLTFLHHKYWHNIPLTLLLFTCEVLFGIFLIMHGICMTSLTCGILFVVAILLLAIVDIVGIVLETYRHKSIWWKQWLLMLVRPVAVLVIIVFLGTNTMQCDSPTREYEPTETIVTAIIILLYWSYIFLACRHLPIMEDYILMFSGVSKTVVKVLGIFSCLIVGFISSFSVLLSHEHPFNTWWKAMIKTLVMMTGEYEYDHLFSSTNESTVNNSTSDRSNNTAQLVVSEIVFLSFMLLISIVLMNLMVGLAVSDVERLLRDSRSLRLINQARAATRSQWRGFRYLFSPFLTKLGWQTTGPTHIITVEVDLKSSSYLFWREISADVKSALYNLALKNSIRDERHQPESPRDNIQESLATIRSSLATMQSSIDKIIAEQQQQNLPMVDRRGQEKRTMVNRQRCSI